MHIVMLCVDAMRADHIGCYAGEDRGTPHMDRLAAEGVYFGNAISQASWTRPAVTSMMTGLYPSQHVMTDAPDPNGVARLIALGAETPTIAGSLSGAGWATSAFIAGNAYLKPEFGILRGFEHVDWLTTTDGRVVIERYDAWLAASRPERSFTYLHLMEPHNPLPKDILSSRPAVDKGVDVDALGQGLEALLEYYRRSVSRADERIGEVLGVLAAHGMAEDTWVMVTADHGEELNEHGAMLSHGQSLYRSLLWVPLLMRFPDGRGAGRRIAEPVAHIDLMPTILEAAGVDCPDVPGQSLLPRIDGGAAAPEAAAFAELLKRSRYARSVTTSTHQLIETFHVTESQQATLDDLEVGELVEIKGQPAQGGSFVPTKLTVDPKAREKLIGTVEAVDPGSGHLTVMGVPVRITTATEMIGLDKGPVTLDQVPVGSRVGVDFGEGAAGDAGRRPAALIMRRKEGGESKLEGAIEAVERNGPCRIRVLGRWVPVDGSQVRLVDLRGVEMDWSRHDVVATVTAGRYTSRQAELYAVSDRDQAQDLTGSAGDVARSLAQRLESWGEEVVAGTAGTVIDLDQDTIAQLRALGYLD